MADDAHGTGVPGGGRGRRISPTSPLQIGTPKASSRTSSTICHAAIYDHR
jgi:hypothetical protein